MITQRLRNITPYAHKYTVHLVLRANNYNPKPRSEYFDLVCNLGSSRTELNNTVSENKIKNDGMSIKCDMHTKIYKHIQYLSNVIIIYILYVCNLVCVSACCLCMYVCTYVRVYFFMFGWSCISSYICTINQNSALFVLTLLNNHACTCFGPIWDPSWVGSKCMCGKWYLFFF
jgi:hypothetical protein